MIASLTPFLLVLGPIALLVAMGIVFAETGLLVGFFLPGDSLLFTLGVLAAGGLLHLPFWLVAVGLLVAAVAGDQVGYLLGRRFGPRVFSRTESRFFSRSHAERAQAFFAKHGPKAVVLARFVPVVRTFTPVVAGVARMPRRRFAAYNVLGAVAWTTGLLTVGFYFGGAPLIAAHIELFAIGVVVLSLIPAAGGLVRSHKVRARQTSPLGQHQAQGRGMMSRRIAAAVSVAGLFAGLVALPLSALLNTAEPTTRTVETASGNAVGTARVSQPANVMVIAHRGFSDIAPENTVPAMRAATSAGADLVEFDVQRTADGHLIVVHDSTFARTTDVGAAFPGREADPVGSFTLAQVRQLDAGSWKGPQFIDTRVPTLGELLAAMHPTRTDLLLELKDPDLYPGYESQVAHELSRHGFIGAGRVFVHSFDAAALAAFHHAAPTVPLGLITENGTGAVPAGQDTWLRTINPTVGTVTDAGVDGAQARHLKVFAWPLDSSQSSAAQVERLVDDGVDGIITDNPVLVRHEIAAGDGTTT